MRHLIHIGYPKAGSTFLRKWFEKHPQICYSREGLGGFHNVYDLARHAAAQADNYACFVTSSEAFAAPSGNAGREYVEHSRTTLENVPIKISQTRVCITLREIFQAAKILMVTRGFRSALRSGYSQYVRTGGVLGPKGLFHSQPSLFAEYYDYDYLIDQYSAAFGKENLILLPYELLRDDRNQFLACLAGAIEVEFRDIESGRLNASLRPEELYWYPRLSRGVVKFVDPLGDRISTKILKWYNRQTMNNGLRIMISGLNKLSPNRCISESDFPESVLEYCRGRATRLACNPLYSRYASEYFL